MIVVLSYYEAFIINIGDKCDFLDIFCGCNFGELKNSSIFALAISKEGLLRFKIGAVVQLVRIPACHAGGRGFESRPHRSGERRWTTLLENSKLSILSLFNPYRN